MDYIVLMLSSLDGITDEPVFKQWLVIRYDLVLRRKGTTAVCCLNAVFPFAIPENPQRKCFHFLIDLGLSVLLFQLMHRENRGLDRIYLILSPPPSDGYIPYPTSRHAAKQVYSGYWWTQTKHLFPPPPFLLCLYFFPLRIVGRIAFVRPIYFHLPPSLPPFSPSHLPLFVVSSSSPVFSLFPFAFP